MVTILTGSINRLVQFALLLLLLASCSSAKVEELGIIPRPLDIKMGKGSFHFVSQTIIKVNSDDPVARNVAREFSERMAAITGYDLPVGMDDGRTGTSNIIFRIDYSLMEELGMEGYLLNIDRHRIEILAAWPDGLFYGTQTIYQMLPPETFSENPDPEGRRYKLPCLSIKDKPAFSWRGMHLDVSRHFFPKEFIKRYIDLIAMHKMNVFHWHLTDDNGWRLQTDKYPLLTDVSAWRVDREDSQWMDREPQKEGEEATYGGYYTKEDVREIILYARDRFVKVIPEIEMPGHSSEVFAAYPEYSCTGERLTVVPGSYWPNVDILCAGKEETFRFIEDILSEVAELFPSEYIHIGGDEADKTRWKACRHCQQRISEEGLQDENELQSYFIKRVEKMLTSNGKHLIGWDEILEGGLAPEATVMSWRGFNGGMEAARQGHDVVMSPTSYCYFDYYQADPEFEPEAIGGYLTLKKVYSFRPVPAGLMPAERKHILGGQGNVWTEYIPTPKHAEYMALPRMTAMAEVLWTREDLLDWNDFRDRLKLQLGRFDALGVNYSRGSYRVEPKPVTSGGKYSVVLETEGIDAKIRYTLDETLPGPGSELFVDPIRIDSSMVIKAVAFVNGSMVEKPAVIAVEHHKALGAHVEYVSNYDERYSGSGTTTLVDGLSGSAGFNSGRWQGFHGNDAKVIIDLGERTIINRVELNTLLDQRRWIFLPVKVSLMASEEGEVFRELETISQELQNVNGDAAVHKFTFNLDKPEKVRYVMVEARNIGLCPPWHEGAGQPAWLFIDEITVK